MTERGCVMSAIALDLVDHPSGALDFESASIAPFADREAEFFADKERRMSSIASAQNKEEASTAFRYIKVGLDFLYDHSGKIAIIAAVTAGILAGVYYSDYLSKLFSGWGLGDGSFGFGGDRVAETIGPQGSATVETARSVAEQALPQIPGVPADAIRTTTDVFLTGDAHFDPTPIVVNGQRYSVQAFFEKLPSLVSDPAAGDSLRLNIGEHCRVTMEQAVREGLKERMIPHTFKALDGMSLDAIGGNTFFDPYGNLEKARYFQEMLVQPK